MPLGLSSSAAGRSASLHVPYLIQPHENDCQSTCLKMFALYLERSGVAPAGKSADTLEIGDIRQAINHSGERPDKKNHNSHENMRWWLGRQFPALSFVRHTHTDGAAAVEEIVDFIDHGMPVIVSVSHARVKGHIVIVVGYENYQPYQSSADFRLLVHDPYGSFDPALLSNLHSKKRTYGGASLARGGEQGPGMNCRLPLTAVSRHRAGDQAFGTYYLISAQKLYCEAES